jgi:hypothetical protein
MRDWLQTNYSVSPVKLETPTFGQSYNPNAGLNYSYADIAEAKDSAGQGWMDWLPGSRTIDPANMSFLDRLYGGFDKQGNKYAGFGGALLSTGKSALDTWLGLKQLDLAEDTFDFQKSAWQQQFDNQTSLINTQLRDRQSALVSRDPNHYQSVEDYMKQNAVG